jgi:rod shape-determining protein MreC
MRNIVLFIRRYFNFLLFLLLQGVSLFMLFSYNKYHNSVFMSVANEVSGKINEQYNRVHYYFNLQKTNDSLMNENARLYNKLRQNFNLPDTVVKTVIDTIKIDSLEQYRSYQYRHAKVVASDVHAPNNYITINRGSSGGIRKDLGVINENNAVVGTVVDLNNNYSVVMSMLHKRSTVSAKHKKSGEPGLVSWDGKDHHYVYLRDISKSAKVSKGDSIVTSGLTPRFPYGLLIGFVEEVVKEQTTNNYVLKVKTAADFANLQYVFVIDQINKSQIDSLLKRAESTHE